MVCTMSNRNGEAIRLPIFKIAWVAVLKLALGFSMAAEAQSRSDRPQLSVLYEQYPPYTYTNEQGQMKGIISDRLRQLARAVGAQISWQESNYNRIVRELWSGQSEICAAGYSLESFDVRLVKSAGPLAVVRNDTIAIKASDLPRFKAHGSFADVLSDNTLRGAFIQGADYAEFEEKQLGRLANPHLFVNATDIDLGILVSRGRADFAMIDAQQTQFIRDHIEGTENLVSYRISGFPETRSLYLICGNAISSLLWNKIDDAIPKLFANPLVGDQ